MQTAQTFFASLIEQLELYVRQSAWLQTVPDKAKSPRIKTTPAVMPPLEAGAYLVNILFEAGPVRPIGMGGLVSIDEIDLVAWQQNRDLRLTAWETKIIRRLSHIYASAAIDARDPKSRAPYITTPTTMSDAQRQRISRAMSDWADKLNGKSDSQ